MNELCCSGLRFDVSATEMMDQQSRHALTFKSILQQDASYLTHADLICGLEALLPDRSAQRTAAFLPEPPIHSAGKDAREMPDFV